jgi:hypothetical protein
MWKIDPKDKCIHKTEQDHTHLYVEHVCNSGTTLQNLREEKEKGMIRVNNIKIQYICAGRGRKGMYESY